jgi:DNA-binding transcriptional MocR family regulator
MPPGNAQLLRHITARYHADGVPVDDGEIVITNGALEALNLCLAAVTRPGDSVIIECPCFYGALQSLERRGLKAVHVPTSPVRGVDIQAVEDAIRRHRPRAAWLMTTFQNPLGCLMAPDEKRALVALLARHGVPLIEDDVYQELFFGPQRPLPAKAYDGEGTVLHCSSFSKCLAPGYRVGWVAAGRHAQALRRQKLTLSILTAVPVQVGLARYLDQGGYERHLRRLRATFQSQRDAMGEALSEYFPEGTEATRPQGGYFLWVKLPQGCDALDLHAQAAAHGIRFAPGPMFSATGEFRDCLRLNYGREWTPATDRAIATLGKLLRRPRRRAA